MKLRTLTAAGCTLAGIAVSNVAFAQGGWPQLSMADLAPCRPQIAQLHQLELAYFRQQISEECSPSQNYSAHNCGVFQQALSESQPQNDMAWYYKGNGSCGGGDYPCFGVEVLHEPRSGEDETYWIGIFERNIAQTGTTLTPGTDFWDAGGIVDNCTTAIWLKKYKAWRSGGVSPTPNPPSPQPQPQQVASRPAPVSASDPAFNTRLQTSQPDQLVQLAQELLSTGQIDLAKLARNALLQRFPDSPLVPQIVDMLVTASKPGVAPTPAPQLQQVQPLQQPSAAPTPAPAYAAASPRIVVYDAASVISAFAQVGYSLIPGAQANQLKDAQNRFSVYFLDCNGSRCGALQILADYNISPMPAADRVAQWNRDKLYGRGYISNGMVNFDMAVKIPSNGIEPLALKEQVDLFLNATSLFYNFVQYR